MGRVKLTKSRAQGLLRAREGSGRSQYDLAEELGWVRSKIKRIERAEIASIDEEDLVQLQEALNVKEPVSKRGMSSSKTVIKLFPRSTKVEELFTRVVRQHHRQKHFKNQVFFMVTLKVARHPREFRGLELELDGVRGAIHGVEHATDQIPIGAGERVSIMLWGEGIASQRPGARKRSDG